MPKCSYCGKMYDIPHGLTLVMTDGTIKHLCSSKCQKNMKLKRRKTKWISKMKKTKAEKLAEVIEQAKEEHETVEVPESKEEEKSKGKAPEKSKAKEGKKEKKSEAKTEEKK